MGGMDLAVSQHRLMLLTLPFGCWVQWRLESQFDNKEVYRTLLVIFNISF